MGFARDTDIGRVRESDVSTQERVETVLEHILGQEISDPESSPEELAKEKK